MIGGNDAIFWSSVHGKFEVAKNLLKDRRVDPSVNNNEAMIEAIENGYSKIVRLLSTDERVISRLKEENRDRVVKSWIK